MIAPATRFLLCLLLTFQLALQPVFAAANSGEHRRLETFYTNTQVNVGGGLTVAAIAKLPKVLRVAIAGRAPNNALCFVAGTPVLTTEGYKNIEDIQLGDRVISHDEKRGITVVRPVTELFRNKNKEIYSVTLVAGDGQSETLGATQEHPFYVDDKGWVEAAKLQPGDRVARFKEGKSLVHQARADGEGQAGFLLVKSIELQDERQDTFNFEVADTHTYFVGKLNA